MLTRFLTWLRNLCNRMLGRTPSPSDGGPTVTPSFGGRSR